MESFVAAFKALSEPTRLRIMALVCRAGRELCVCEFVDALEEPQYHVSRSLKILQKAGLVVERRVGKWVHYGLPASLDCQLGRLAHRALYSLRSDGWVRSLKLACVWVFALVLVSLGWPAHAQDQNALAFYRSSWNPLTAGPQLITTADLLAPGQFFVKSYTYSEFGWAQYGDSWSTGTQPLAQHLSVVNPQLEFDYGISDSLQTDLYVPVVSWWQGPGGGQPARQGTGVGDITLDLRYRFLIQRPGTWRPSLALVSYVALPTSSWFNTPSTPGGFAPLGKLPSTHFGTPEITEAIVFRKNVRPFRVSGGVYYSYALPSSNDGVPERYGDIFQYRLAFEHVLNDEHGFGYSIELIGVHGLPFRIDGSSVTAGKKNFGVVGVQPTIECNLTHRIVASAGVLFPVAGENDIAGVFPNFSIYYYFGKVRPR